MNELNASSAAGSESDGCLRFALWHLVNWHLNILLLFLVSTRWDARQRWPIRKFHRCAKSM